MQLSAQKVRYEPRRSLGYVAIIAGGAMYVPIGTAFANPPRMLKLTNLTDADLDVSFDGITDEDIVAAGQAWIYDYCSNASEQAGNLEQAAQTFLYVRVNGESAAPTKKSVYVTLIYASTV